MGNLFTSYTPVSKDYQNDKIDVLLAYEKAYHELIRKYKGEIQFIEEKLSELRKEREIFYDETLDEIEQKLQKNKYISEEAKKEWMQELRDNMERSFGQSENIIQHYITNNTEEFSKAVKRILLGE